ncbi:MAG: glycosyltransferase [Chloracidobacterium sp.]|nr:glycosyltransferase [Chloracidobacterium sp.]
MIFVFYFFAAILVWLSLKSFLGGIAYLKFFREQLAKPGSDHTPFATIIVPCRGLDKSLDENLAAFLKQDYPQYEVIFVVDDKNDPAVAVIESILSRNDDKGQTDFKQDIQGEQDSNSDYAGGSTYHVHLVHPVKINAKFVIARKAQYSSQKVENLREAVLHVSDQSQVFVFADSDARPSTDWLRALVAPLADENVGAATGYRWFIAKHPTFGSELRSAWNASITSALGPNIKSNFCWGGSMAMRRDIFERLEMREKWSGVLSDDFAVTRTVKAAGLSIIFVPQALTATVEDCTLRETVEFTTRQMKITRVYATPLWVVSLIGTTIFNAVLIAALLIVILSKTNSVAVWASLATLILVTVFSTGKAWLRLNAVRLVLPQYDAELRRQFWTQNTLWLIAPSLFLYNSLAAWASRRMIWRGITYELKSPAETVIIARDDA